MCLRRGHHLLHVPPTFKSTLIHAKALCGSGVIGIPWLSEGLRSQGTITEPSFLPTPVLMGWLTCNKLTKMKPDSFARFLHRSAAKMIQKLLTTQTDACAFARGVSQMLTILGLLGGTVLAWRFNVFVLFPAILFGWMVVLVSGLLTASPGASIAVHMVFVAIALQFGYLAGIILKWALLASWHHSWFTKRTIMPHGTF